MKDAVHDPPTSQDSTRAGYDPDGDVCRIAGLLQCDDRVCLGASELPEPAGDPGPDGGEAIRSAIALGKPWKTVSVPIAGRGSVRYDSVGLIHRHSR